MELMRELGLAEGGGSVRAGFLHYSTADEAGRLLEALAALDRARSPR
jgi:selenocysteine lyase/cysteine desulfurase